MTNAANTTSILNVRISPDERAILEAAAEQAHMSLSDFMRRKALEAAEVEIFEPSDYPHPCRGLAGIWIDRPAETVPALSELARRPSSYIP